MIESVYVSIENKTGVISTDDLLARLQRQKAVMIKQNIKVMRRGEMNPKNYDGNNLCLMATDVEALFPSLNAQEASRICKEVIQKSNVMFEGVELSEALLYIALNKDGLEPKDLELLKPYIPTRKSFGRNSPTMKNALVKGPRLISEWKVGDSLWHHPAPQNTIGLQKLIMAVVVQIGVRELFSNFCYTF